MSLDHKVLERHLAQYSSDLWTITTRAEGNDSDCKGVIARQCGQRQDDGGGSEGAWEIQLK